MDGKRWSKVSAGVGIALAFAAVVAVRGARPAAAGSAGAARLADFPQKSAYVRTDLISDDANAAPAPIQDPNLVNAWGVAHNPTGPLWVNDNGTGLATVYQIQDGMVPTIVPLIVSIPLPSPVQPPATATPTGLVFNETTSSSTPSFDGDVFIMAAEDGTISGWQPEMPAPPPPMMEAAVRRVDNPQAPDGGPVYKGLALGTSSSGPELFATNFHDARIDVFDGSYMPVTLAPGGFTDPDLPSGYAPFGIAQIGGLLYVTYALQDADKHDDVKGPGHGFVDIYTLDGKLKRHFASRGPLNSPWAVVRAPSDGFGAASNKFLVGNFGDGAINVFGPQGGFRGALRDANGDSIAIDGLWGLIFGNGAMSGPTTTLFFTSGPHEEANGLLGKVEVAGAPM